MVNIVSIHCNLHNNDDEFHFVLKCTLHNEILKRSNPRVYRIRPNKVKFSDLLTCDDKLNIDKLAKYTYFAFKERSNLNS